VALKSTTYEVWIHMTSRNGKICL